MSSGDQSRDPTQGHFDSLAGESSVRLFGRPMWDIRLASPAEREEYYGKEQASDIRPPRMGANNFLVDQLKDPDATLARIMAFSFHNQMFNLARPAVFLVHGEGTQVELVSEAAGDALYLRRMPTFTERSGMVAQRGSFSPEIRMWLYDRADFTVRLDTDTGTFDRLLLDYELGSVASGSMQAGDGDETPRPPGPRGRRRWRGSGD